MKLNGSVINETGPDLVKALGGVLDKVKNKPQISGAVLPMGIILVPNYHVHQVRAKTAQKIVPRTKAQKCLTVRGITRFHLTAKWNSTQECPP